MAKDVIKDRYARLYEIPFQLSKLGHSVYATCLSYHKDAEERREEDTAPGTLLWVSRSLDSLIVPGLLRHALKLRREICDFAPDLLIGASDIPHAALTAWLSSQMQVPYVLDLYDHFESFGQARLPGMKSLLRRAARQADLVTTTSEPLAQLVRDRYRAQGKVISMPSTVDKDIFYPMDKVACRAQLGLPLNGQLIGTAGSLHESKGVNVLYAAWKLLKNQISDLHLVLAGPLDKKLKPPDHEHVHYLGQLPHARTAQLFNALDVGVIYLRNTSFGRYCFPQKAYEMAACRIPFLAARVGAMESTLRDYPATLYTPDDADDLARCLQNQLASPQPPMLSVNDWTHIISALEPELQTIKSVRRIERPEICG